MKCGEQSKDTELLAVSCPGSQLDLSGTGEGKNRGEEKHIGPGMKETRGKGANPKEETKGGESSRRSLVSERALGFHGEVILCVTIPRNISAGTAGLVCQSHRAAMAPVFQEQQWGTACTWEGRMDILGDFASTNAKLFLLFC